MDNSIFQRTLSDFSDSFTKVGKLFQFTKSFFVFFSRLGNQGFTDVPTISPNCFTKVRNFFELSNIFSKNFCVFYKYVLVL